MPGALRDSTACSSGMFEHDPGPERNDQRRALRWALGLNAGLLAFEAIGGLVLGSLALLADAAHQAADVVALAIATVAVSLTARPVTVRHTFGLARAEVLAAQTCALMMLGAGLVIVVEALARLQEPVEVRGTGLALVAAVGVAVNGAGAIRVRRSQGHSLSMRASVAHLATDAAGSLAALVAGVVIGAWGWMWADALAAGFTAILILWAGGRLLRESTHVLMEGTPRGLDPQHVHAVIVGIDGVADVHHLHLWSLASDVHACSAHVVLAGQPTLGEAQRSARAVKSALAVEFALTNVTLELEQSSGGPRTQDATPSERTTTAPPEAEHGSG